MSNIHQLHPAGHITGDNTGVAAKLRELADLIEAGERGEVTSFIGVITSELPLRRVWFGKSGSNIAELIGTLQMVIINEALKDD